MSVGERASAAEVPERGEYFEVFRETATMALYLAIVLLAELSAWPVGVGDSSIVISAIWGTAVGLAIAHWFAFSVSTRLLWGGHEERVDRLASAGQLAAAVVIALLTTIPFLFGSTASAFTAAGAVLVVLIGFTGVRVARAGGAGWPRALWFALVIVAIASVVVGVKAGLTH